MENVRNRMNLHLTTDHDNAVNWFSKPEFKKHYQRRRFILNRKSQD